MFIAEFIRNPRTVGAIAESSPGLAELITAPVDWRNAERVVELGSGSGSFTSVIMRKRAPNCRFVAFETNTGFARRTQQIVALAGDRGLVVNGAFEHHFESALSFLGGQAEAVISGLPWAFFEPTYQDQLLDVVSRLMAPSGQFLTFGYLPSLLLPTGRRIPRRFREVFHEVHRSRVVWRNLPPAFVYCCSGVRA